MILIVIFEITKIIPLEAPVELLLLVIFKKKTILHFAPVHLPKRLFYLVFLVIFEISSLVIHSCHVQAYARAPVLTINGGNGGFDGYRLGLNGLVFT